jgi:hypothetical protein
VSEETSLHEGSRVRDPSSALYWALEFCRATCDLDPMADIVYSPPCSAQQSVVCFGGTLLAFIRVALRWTGEPRR